MPSLYQIDSEYQELISRVMDIAEDNEGEVPDCLFEELEKLECDRSAKIENTALFIKNCVSDAKAIKEEEGKLKKRRVALEKKAKWLKDMLSTLLHGRGFISPKCSVSFRKSESLVLSGDYYDIPDCYMRKKEEVVAVVTAYGTNW